MAPARPRLVGLVAALALACLLALPAGASAHAFLLETAPAQGVLLPTPPLEVVLGFSEGFDVVETRIDAGAERVDAGPATVRDGRSLVIPVRPGAPDGAYVATWRIVSQDGHVVDGSLVFSVGDAAVATTGAPTAADGSDDLVDAAAAATRLLHLGGLLVLLGGLAFAFLVWEPLVATPGAVAAAADAAFGRTAARVATLALVALALGAILTLPVHRWQTGLPVADLLGSRFGQTGLARLVLLPVAALAIPALAQRDRRRAAGALAGLGGLSILPALAGHASTSGDVVTAVGGQWLHTVAAALWVGGLALLATAVVAAARAAPGTGIPRAAVARFGPVAIVAVGGLALTGALYAWREVGSLGALRDSSWGNALGLKTLLVVIALGLGLLVRRGVAAVRPGARAELAVLALVLATTAVLVGLAPPRTGDATGVRVSAPPVATAASTLALGPNEVYTSISPATAGASAQLHMIAVVTNTGAPARLVSEAQARLVGPDGRAVDVPLEVIGDAHWTGPVVFAQPGRYTLRIGLVRGEFDLDRAETSFEVR